MSIRQIIAGKSNGNKKERELNPKMIYAIEKEPEEDDLEYFVGEEYKTYVPNHHLMRPDESIGISQAENMILRHEIKIILAKRIVIWRELKSY